MNIDKVVDALAAREAMTPETAPRLHPCTCGQMPEIITETQVIGKTVLNEYRVNCDCGMRTYTCHLLADVIDCWNGHMPEAPGDE